MQIPLTQPFTQKSYFAQKSRPDKTVVLVAKGIYVCGPQDPVAVDAPFCEEKETETADLGSGSPRFYIWYWTSWSSEILTTAAWCHVEVVTCAAMDIKREWCPQAEVNPLL